MFDGTGGTWRHRESEPPVTHFCFESGSLWESRAATKSFTFRAAAASLRQWTLKVFRVDHFVGVRFWNYKVLIVSLLKKSPVQTRSSAHLWVKRRAVFSGLCERCEETVTVAEQTKKRPMTADEENETEVRFKNTPAITDYCHRRRGRRNKMKIFEIKTSSLLLRF